MYAFSFLVSYELFSISLNPSKLMVLRRITSKRHTDMRCSTRSYLVFWLEARRAIVFPTEVCTVVEGQIYKKKVPQELTSHVVKFATSKPEDRLATIQQGSGMRVLVSVTWYINI
jgi:hypothetical protein